MNISRREMLYIESLEEVIKNQADYVEEIRAIKHDMEAHLIVLHHYLKGQEYERACVYLEKLLGAAPFQKCGYTEIGNAMVNALIEAKLSKSQVAIELETSGLLPEDLIMQDVDVCTIFSNLVANSIEACEKLKKCKREIHIHIEEAEELRIVIANPVEWEVDIACLGTYTTKADEKNHGIGLRNVKEVVNRYHGNLEATCEAGVFQIKIDLPRVATVMSC